MQTAARIRSRHVVRRATTDMRTLTLTITPTRPVSFGIPAKTSWFRKSLSYQVCAAEQSYPSDSAAWPSTNKRTFGR